MPLDQVQSYDYFYDRVVGTELKFSWLPQTCHLSGKRIWLKKGYCLTRVIIGPDDTLFDSRWHDKNAHIIWKLTK